MRSSSSSSSSSSSEGEEENDEEEEEEDNTTTTTTVLDDEVYQSFSSSSSSSYDSDADDTYDGEVSVESDSGFVNELSDEAHAGFGIENDYDSDGNAIPSEEDEEEEDDDDDDFIDEQTMGAVDAFFHNHPDLTDENLAAASFEDMEEIGEEFLQYMSENERDDVDAHRGEYSSEYSSFSGTESDERDSGSTSSASSERERDGAKDGDVDGRPTVASDANGKSDQHPLARILERIKLRDEMEAKKDNENNNITIFTNRKRKNTMEEEKIQADGEDEDDDDDDEEDRDFDPDESETSLSKPSVMEEDDGTKMGRMLRLATHDIYNPAHGCRMVRRVVITNKRTTRGEIQTAMVHRQGADAVCSIPMSCAEPDLKSNALPYASEVVLLGTNKLRAIKAIGDKKRCTKTVLDETEKLPFKIYSASVCPETKMIAICGVHDYGTRGGLSEGSANVAVFSLNPEDMPCDGYGSVIDDSPRNSEPQKRFAFLAIENIGFPHDERTTADGRLIDPVIESNSSDAAEQANCIRWGTHTRLKEEYIEEYEKKKAKASMKESNKAKRNQASSTFDEAQFRKEYIEEAKNHFETKHVLLLSSNDGHVYILGVDKFDAKTLMEKAEKREKRLRQLDDDSGNMFLTRLEQFRLRETHKITKLDAIFVGAPVNCAVAHPSGKYIAVATDSTIIPVIGNEIFGYSSSFDSIKETFYPRSEHGNVKGFELTDGFKEVTFSNGAWLEANNATAWRECSGNPDFRLNRVDVMISPSSELAYHHTPLVFRPEDLSESRQQVGEVPTYCQYLAFSANGKYLAATSDSRKCLSVWRVEQPSDVLELECFDYPTETRPFRVMHALMINPLVRFHGFHLPLLPLAFAPSNEDILMITERGNKRLGSSGAHVIDLSKFERFGGYISGRRKAFEQNVRETIEKTRGKNFEERRAFFKANGEKLLNSVEPDPLWYRQPYERAFVTPCRSTVSPVDSIPVSSPLNSEKLKPKWTLRLNVSHLYSKEELDDEKNSTRNFLPIDWTSVMRMMFYEVHIPNSTEIYSPYETYEGGVIGVEGIEIPHVNYDPKAGIKANNMEKHFLHDPVHEYFDLKKCMQTISEPFEGLYITGLAAVGPPLGFNNTYPDIFYVTTPDSLEIFRCERGWSPMTIFRSSNRRLKFLSGRTRKMQWHNSMFSTDFRDAALTLLLCIHRIQKTNSKKKHRPREETNLGDLTNDCVLKIIEAMAKPTSDWIDRDHDVYVEHETIVLSDGKGESEKIDLY